MWEPSSRQPTSDWLSTLTLLARLQQGGTDSDWNAFLQRFRPLICRGCRRSGVHVSLLEELADEIVAKLFEKLPQGKYDPAKGDFRGWLSGVVANAAEDFRRKFARRPEYLANGAPRTPPNEAALVEEVCQPLERDLAGIQRHIERLRHLAGASDWEMYSRTMLGTESAADVAASLGKTRGAVYTACNRVRKIIERYGQELQARGEG